MQSIKNDESLLISWYFNAYTVISLIVQVYIIIQDQAKPCSSISSEVMKKKQGRLSTKINFDDKSVKKCPTIFHQIYQLNHLTPKSDTFLEKTVSNAEQGAKNQMYTKWAV